MKDKKLIAFDLYDTCLEFTIPSEQLSYKQLFYDLGLQRHRKDIKNILLISQKNIEDIVTDFCPEAKTHTAMERYQENYQNEIESIQLFPETKDILSALKDRWYKIAVVSNISIPYTKALYRLLPHTFNYEILSCNVGVSKPDKKIFDCLKNISWYHPDEMVMVGDSIPSDIKWAMNAGIDPIHIDRTSRWIQHHDWYISISSLDQLLEIL
jgi:HAD superfamily hydrolase (TIGR01549 family)